MILIVIPNYKTSKFLKRIAPTIKEQTYTDWKVSIYFDGHDEKIYEVQEVYDEVIGNGNYIITGRPNNKGANYARNEAITAGVKEFGKPKSVYFCDADAELYPQCLEELNRALDKKHAYAYCGYKRMGIINDAYWSREFDLEQLRKENYISYMSLVKWNVLIKYLPLNNNLKGLQDWHLFLSMADDGHYGKYVKKILFNAHIRNEGITGLMRGNDEERKRTINYIKQLHKLL